MAPAAMIGATTAPRAWRMLPIRSGYPLRASTQTWSPRKAIAVARCAVTEAPEFDSRTV